MSENIHQVYIANPITVNVSTDLMYFGQSPYGPTNDVAMTFANFAAQFASSTAIISPTYGGTGVSNPTAHGIMIAEGASAMTPIVLTAGQVLIGTTASDPTGATISAGTNISVTSASGSITIAATGNASFSWNDVPGTSQAAAINNGYIISNASATTVTVPAVAAEGSVIAVQGKGAAGWILQMNTGQTCHLGNQTTSSAGTLSSTNQWDSISIVCVTANTVWAVTSAVGNLTVA